MLRELSKRPLTWIFLALPAMIFASCLAAGSDGAGRRECAEPHGPSKFDYLVLASIADSPDLPAMAGYRSTAQSRSGSEQFPTDN